MSEPLGRTDGDQQFYCGQGETVSTWSVQRSRIEHMFDTLWIADLDAESACAVISGTQWDLREHEWRELALASHWATLHDPETIPCRNGPTLPGTERSMQLGGEGTPQVTEFACAELGLMMGVGFVAADNLMRDALDLQHRHPLMWAALGGGAGRVWKARQVARTTHAAGLTTDQAHYVDAATTPYVDTLTWSAFTDSWRRRSSRPTPRPPRPGGRRPTWNAS